MSVILICQHLSQVGFEVFTAVTMKNAVFWDVVPCRSCELNRRSSETLVQFTRSTWRHIPEDDLLLSEVFELCHIFKESASDLYITVLP
jgi:hypothetical protein